MALNNISNKALEILNSQSFNYVEQWQYTDVRKFKKISHCKKQFDLIDINTIENNTITVINNSQIKNNLLNKEIGITTISKALKNNQYNCKKIFNNIIPEYKNEFILYNTAYFQKGFFLHIHDNTIIKNPIYINNIIKANSPNEFINLRYLFHFGKNINAQIIIKDDIIENLNLNSVIEVIIEENSIIDIIIESEKINVTQIMNFSSIIKNNSELNIYSIDISGKLVRNNYFINLEYENSTCNYSGVSLLKTNDHIDNFIEMNHENKYTFSSSNQKNILRQNSKSIFYSKSTINKRSSFSEANQKNKNIMLSKKAIVHSNPQLEIYNNDVKCSHGSTTGELDEQMLFYMRSRGLSLEAAKKMLLEGFLNEFIDSIKNKEFSVKLKNKINNWF